MNIIIKKLLLKKLTLLIDSNMVFFVVKSNICLSKTKAYSKNIFVFLWICFVKIDIRKVYNSTNKCFHMKYNLICFIKPEPKPHNVKRSVDWQDLVIGQVVLFNLTDVFFQHQGHTNKSDLIFCFIIPCRDSFKI